MLEKDVEWMKCSLLSVTEKKHVHIGNFGDYCCGEDWLLRWSFPIASAVVEAVKVCERNKNVSNVYWFMPQWFCAVSPTGA